jgi:hypothetical protein
MFYTLIVAAAVFFLAHVILLFTSFPGTGFLSSRYFYSHLTLWITGIIIFTLAILYSGTNVSGFFDYFDTPFKKGMILIFTFGLSLVAHCIVRYLVLPAVSKSKR